MDEIHKFEERARTAGIANETVLAARYALCASLDEAVLSTPWGAQSEWAQQTLLVALHREAWGGEKFFEMLDRISRDPARHIDPDGVAVSLPRRRLHREVPRRRARTRAARRSPAGPLPPDPRASRHAAAGVVAPLARASRTAATRSSATCRGGWSAPPRSRSWRSPSRSTTRGSAASPRRCTRRWRTSASKISPRR